MSMDNKVPIPDQEQYTYENAAKAKRTIVVEHYAQRMAYTGQGLPEYIGLSVPGSTTSAAVWQIRKLVYTGTNATSVLWCDGDNNFDNTWDSYDSHSYS